MLSLRILAVALGVLAADVGAQESVPASSSPMRGQSMQAVLQQFGEPVQRHAPVGGSSSQQPPITRWDYPDFAVYFENQHVINTVNPQQPRTVLHLNELRTPDP